MDPSSRPESEYESDATSRYISPEEVELKLAVQESLKRDVKLIPGLAYVPDPREALLNVAGNADKNRENESVPDPKECPNEKIPGDLEILCGILKFFVAKNIKQPYIFGHEDMKDLVNNFLHSNADPEAVARRIMELMARPVDSLNNKDDEGNVDKNSKDNESPES